MKFLDPEIVPPEEGFALFDWDTLLWVGVGWIILAILIGIGYVFDRMTEDVLNILPKDEPQKPQE